MKNKTSGAEKTVREIFSKAGVEFNGPKPTDIKVIDSRCFKRILADGSLGLGESYMEGWIECDDIAGMISKLIMGKIDHMKTVKASHVLLFLQAKLSNRQSKKRSAQVANQHYNLGNDLYEAMLDKRMFYTCGYWKDATNLNDAQDAKADLVARKLDIKPTDKVLDIGCGWGSMQNFIWEKYKTPSTGITVSAEQAKYAKSRIDYPEVKFELQDYRDAQGQYNKVVSLGMLEHVGPKNLKEYFQSVNRLMTDDGLFLLHFIGGEDSHSKEDPWIDKYIFVNSVVPSLAKVLRASEGMFVPLDVQNFGVDYDKTLVAWFENFDKAWPKLKDKYDDKFYRMWKYYLLMCAGTFRPGMNQLYQIVFSKTRNPKRYNSPR